MFRFPTRADDLNEIQCGPEEETIDISSDHELEALRESEQRYREIFENTKDAIYVHDLSGRYLLVNKAGERLIGYTRGELLNLTIFDVVPPVQIDQIRESLEQKTGEPIPTTYQLEAIRKDGERVPVEVSSRLIYRAGKPVAFQGTARDISERKRAEAALRESELQLQQSQKLEAVGQLAGGVAHDFNNLLTAILGYSELGLRRLPTESPVRRDLQEIQRAANRAASLTRQLLAFSRKQILEPEVLDLNLVVGDMHKMLHRLIGEDIDLVTVLAKGLGRVKADPGQIEQIIVNLVVNARDATPGCGKVTIETANVYLNRDYALEHPPTQPGEYVMLAVSDTGVGMDAETQAKIFEPFFTTKGIGKGTGLGLSMVYGIVKQSGGFVWLSSEEKVGTTFKVYLPRLLSGGEIEETTVTNTTLPAGAGTILLVEDDSGVRRMAKQSLQLVGFRVLEAWNGNDGLAIARTYGETIHLLITDVVMPQMGGRELAERLGALRPEMRVLFMSGYTDDAIVRHGIMDKDIAFLQKPFTCESLADKVAEVLQSPAQVL